MPNKPDDVVLRMGRNLRAMRLQADLDIDGLAIRTGLTPSALCRYETGRECIPVAALVHLAQALGRAVDDFFA